MKPYRLTVTLLLAIFLGCFLFNCAPPAVEYNPDCELVLQEVFQDTITDPTLLEKGKSIRDSLANVLGESTFRNPAQRAYHLLYFASHGVGWSIKFYKDSTAYVLSFKDYTDPWLDGSADDFEDYSIEITEDEWSVFEEMIYEFDFWTAERSRIRTLVYDDIAYLEGFRPEAEKCGGSTYRFIDRASSGYDKMGALCEYIYAYQVDLAYRYGLRQGTFIHW